MSIQAQLLAAPQVPLRYLVQFNPRPTPTESGESCYLPMEAISEFGAVDSSRMRPTLELSQGYSFVADGDVAYAKVTPCFENGKGFRAAGLPGGHAFATTEITVMRPSCQLDSRYLAWILQSEEFRAPGEAHMSGAGGLRRVPESYAARYRVPQPSIDVQQAIADYLDRETAQIDAFIAKIKGLIGLLAERRAAVLAAAMRTTSRMMPLRQVLAVAQTGPFGTQLSAVEYVANGVPVINPSHIVHGAIVPDTGVSVSRERALELSRFRLTVNDIVLGRKGEVDKAGLVEGAADGYLCGSDSMMLRPEKRIVHPKYLWWFLQSPAAHEQLERFAVGSTVAGLNQRTLRDVRLPVPTLTEQQRIVGDLDQATAAIWNAVSVAKRSVELARERRAALISAAVTGKIDVGVVA